MKLSNIIIIKIILYQVLLSYKNNLLHFSGYLETVIMGKRNFVIRN